MFDRSRVVITTNHYRPIIFYELTIRNLIKRGYKKYVIQNTGGSTPTHILKVAFSGAEVLVSNFPHNFSYYDAMGQLKSLLTPSVFPEADIVFFLDNDCFCTPEALDHYIEMFLEGNYDWTSHFPGQATSDQYFADRNDELIHIQNQVVYRGNNIPPGYYHPSCPDFSPVPHYENAYMLLKRSIWDQMTSLEASHGCRFIDAVHTRFKGKIGALRANYSMPSYIQTGDGWVHLTRFMYMYIRLLEEGNTRDQALMDARDIYQARMGIIALWDKWLSKLHMPSNIVRNLDKAYGLYGGQEACIEALKKACGNSFVMDENYWRQASAA